MSDALMEQVTFRRLLARSLGLPLGLMAILMSLLVWQITSLLNASQWVDHTNQVVSQAHETLDLLIDKETGKRGYLISGKSEFLEPYDRAMTLFPPSFAALQRLVADNPRQSQSLIAIHATFEPWENDARAEIALRKAGKNYLTVFDTARGKRLMDSLRGQFKAFIQAEESLRRQRSAAARKAAHLTLACALVLALALGGMLAESNRHRLLSLSRSYETALRLSHERAEALKEQGRVLQASEEHLTTTLQSIGDAVIATDAQGKVTFLNPAAERLTGWAPMEAQGKDLKEIFVIVHEETRQTVESPVEKVIHAGGVVGLAKNTVVIGRGGTETPIDDSSAPMHDNKGDLSGVVLVFQDITERKEAEQAQQESEEQFRATFEQAAVGIAHIGADYKWLRVNQKLCDILGYERDELLTCGMQDITHPDDLNSDFAYVRRMLAGEISAYSIEKRNRRKDGSMVWVNLTVSLVRRPSGEPKFFITVIEDMTERRRLENQLLQAQKLESIGRLAGGVAHDFNNMLSAIMGYTELAAEECDQDTPVQQHLNNVQQAAERASNLTRQLLAFASRQVIEPKIVNLNDLIPGLDKMLRRLIGENIELVMLPDEELHAVKVDPGQFEQILVNLVVNARDAMPEGGKITIETDNVILDEAYAHLHEGAVPGEYVMLAVSDNGTGMEEGIRLHIFEPFFTTKEKGRGTGLGLATVYGIVRQAGGHIWLYSEPGEGTTFKIYLPRTLDSAAAITTALPPPARTGGSETVLLVEDEPSVRAIAVQMLRRSGYTVLEASNGEEAMRVVKGREQDIALLVTDVIMPQMNGRVLAERLHSVHPGLKVLYASGYTENTIVHHGVLEAGIAFLPKPFTSSILARRVREILDEGAIPCISDAKSSMQEN